MTCVCGQDPSDGVKTVGNAQSRIFEHPEDAERIRCEGVNPRRAEFVLGL